MSSDSRSSDSRSSDSRSSSGRSIEELVQRACEDSERPARDAAFEELLDALGSHADAVLRAVDGCSGVVERRDRVRRLRTGRDHLQTRLRLLEKVACSEPSLFVRLEACQGLVDRGPAAEPMLLASLDAALHRGERPQNGPMGDGISILLGALAASENTLAELMQRVREGLPLQVVLRWGQLLLDKAPAAVVHELDGHLCSADAWAAEEAGPWSPARFALAELLLGQGRASQVLKMEVIRTARVPRVRALALDALDASVIGTDAMLEELARASDGVVSRAACRVWARRGVRGRSTLFEMADAALPEASAAWWILVEVAPGRCCARLESLDRSAAMRLLPGWGRRPKGQALLAAVARSSAPPELRVEAARRLRALGEEARPDAVSLWLSARRRLACGASATSGSGELELAARLADALEGLLDLPPDLRRSLDAVLDRMRESELPLLAELLEQLCATEAAHGPSSAGLLYHPDAPARLKGAMGLCAHPMPSLFSTLVRRASEETEAGLQAWLVAAAWAAERALDGPAHKEDLQQLERMNPSLATSLRTPPPPGRDPAVVQLEEWRALSEGERVRSLIAMSRSHVGWTLTRRQARELARALDHPSRGRAIGTLMMSPRRPHALARALAIARRRSAGGLRPSAGRRVPVRAAELAADLFPESRSPERVDVHDEVEEPPEFPMLFPKPPSEALRRPGARVVAPIRGDVASALDVIAHSVVWKSRYSSSAPSIRLGDVLDARSREALRGQIVGRLQRRWQELALGSAFLEWPEQGEISLTDPTVLEALGYIRDAQERGYLPAEGVLGARWREAWLHLLAMAPPLEPALSHLIQTLWIFGWVAPGHLESLFEHQSAIHPDWRPVVLSALLADPVRLPVKLSEECGARALEVVKAASRSVLAATLGPTSGRPTAVDPLLRRKRRTASQAESSSFCLPDRKLARVAPVLAAGAGSLGRQDYPVLRLAVRKSLSPRLEQVDSHLRIANALMVPVVIRRLAAHGRLAELLKLVWCHDLWIPLTFDLRPLLDRSEAASSAPASRKEWKRLAALAESSTTEEAAQGVFAWVRALPVESRRESAAVLEALGLAEPGSLRSYGSERSVAPSWWTTTNREAVVRQVMDDARAHVVLRSERPGRTRIARRTLRRFWRRSDAAELPSLEELRAREGVDAVIEGLIAGLLVHLVDGPPPSSTARAADKQTAIRALRQLCLAWRLQEPELFAGWAAPDSGSSVDDPHALPALLDEPGWMSDDQVHDALQRLHGLVSVTPRELAVELGLSDAQSLPRLLGGRPTELERQCAQILTDLAPAFLRASDGDEPAILFELRPLTTTEALDRGERAGDCSSSTVPFRCVSPHHTYYGVFLEGVPQRGYLTVIEAMVPGPDGRLQPTLVLETINIPIAIFDFVQFDIVHLVEALAHQRGLAPRIALVTSWWAWNYSNREILHSSRVCREGSPVRLVPGDPVCWWIYSELLPSEARLYSPFDDSSTAVLLRPTDPLLERLQPENVHEAQRLRELPRRTLIPTVWEEDAVVGFISSMPSLPDATIAEDGETPDEREGGSSVE